MRKQTHRTITIGDTSVDVVLKDIKNIHLTVRPPAGRVRISAPSRMGLTRVRVFAISRLPWIRKQQERLRQREREMSREYVDGESHYVWGRRYHLEVVRNASPSRVILQRYKMILHTHPEDVAAARETMVDDFLREQLKEAIPPLVAKWEKRMDVSLKGFRVRKMRTRWGSCSPRRGTIRINLELAKKPPDCLEYVLVHELVHLLEPSHNHRFKALMDQFLPEWRLRKEKLNRFPAQHEDWGC